MLRQTSRLVSLVVLMDRLPWPPAPLTRLRGRPKTYSERLIMKALVIMIVRRLYTAYALLAFLNQDDAVAARLRSLLCEQGRFPSRRTWERRLATLPPSLPGVIGYGGRHLVALLHPWAVHGRAVAVDSTALATGGGCGTQRSASRASSPTAPLIRKRAGVNLASMAGGTAGNCIWP
jgi:hypothetical protein